MEETHKRGLADPAKLISAVVPCYNSEAYMENAVNSLLSGGEDMEIIIVDDGSTDRTYEIAKRLESEHPSIVVAVHQENAGHGGAVNKGIICATGEYFKVVDSDDHVDPESLKNVIAKLKELKKEEKEPDLFICNYVYEKAGEGSNVVRHKRSLPVNKLFTMDQMSHFRLDEYLLMHSVIYKTSILRECGIKLPEHTFYVDNIYVYQPLPFIKSAYYMDTNLYRYAIGREDQSVTTKNMMARVDQQLLVTRTMLRMYDLIHMENRHLSAYMFNYLNMMMTISSVFLILRKDPESLKKKDDLWNEVKEYDPLLYKKMTRSILGNACRRKSAFMRNFVKISYMLARKVCKFN